MKRLLHSLVIVLAFGCRLSLRQLPRLFLLGLRVRTFSSFYSHPNSVRAFEACSRRTVYTGVSVLCVQSAYLFSSSESSVFVFHVITAGAAGSPAMLLFTSRLFHLFYPLAPRSLPFRGLIFYPMFSSISLLIILFICAYSYTGGVAYVYIGIHRHVYLYPLD